LLITGNVHETKTHRGSTSAADGSYIANRKARENLLFNNCYNGAPAVYRVKHGVLNIVNAESGVATCLSYGDSFLVLNRLTVKDRISITHTDSMSSSVPCGTLQHFAHILQTLSNDELKELYKVAVLGLIHGTSNGLCQSSQYRELQIHGELLLNRDIQTIAVHSQYRENKSIMKLVIQFAEKHNIEIKFVKGH